MQLCGSQWREKSSQRVDSLSTAFVQSVRDERRVRLARHEFLVSSSLECTSALRNANIDYPSPLHPFHLNRRTSWSLSPESVDLFFLSFYALVPLGWYDAFERGNWGRNYNSGHSPYILVTHENIISIERNIFNDVQLNAISPSHIIPSEPSIWNKSLHMVLWIFSHLLQLFHSE